MTTPVLIAVHAATVAVVWAWILLKRRTSRTNEALRESEARYRSLFEDAPVAYHEIDCGGVVRRVNQAECDLLGVERAQIVGRPIWEFVASEAQQASRLAVARKMAGEQPLAPFEREYKGKNGERIVVEIHERLIQDARGKTAGIRSALLDVTARRRAERACAQASSMLEAVIRASPLAIKVVDLEGLVRTWNPAAEKLFGWSRDEVLGRPAPHAREFQEHLKSVLAGAQIEGVAVRPARRDGTIVDASLWMAPLRDQSGAIDGSLSLMADLTQRKLAERKIRETERRYRDLFENASDIVFSMDLSGAITSLNKAGERAAGYSRAEALRMNLADLLGSGGAGRIEEMMALKLAGGDETEEIAIVARDGRKLLLEVNTRLQFQDGKPVGVEGIARDVTERRRHAEELQRTNAELSVALVAAQEAAAAKSRFLANMSHEIRTPLNGIMGMSQLLLQTPLSVEQRECGDTIRYSADSLLAAINDVLDISQMETGSLHLDPAPFELEKLLDEGREPMEARAQQKGLTLTFRTDPELPRRMVGDASRLRRVLHNLTGNAIKFTEQGGVAVRLDLERTNAGTATMRASVQDTGIGIASGDSSRLFESFVQGDDSTTRRYGGAGLGLAICRRLVELMGGQIGFESEPGRGSTFWFTVELPIAAEQAPAWKPPKAEAPTPPTGIRVLLAEDNDVNQRIALRMLAKLGARADAVKNGREAVEAIERSQYDLILMDVHMPEMDGLAATAEIRRRQDGMLHTPIVAMTAKAMAGDREECLAAGMDDYITKPIMLEDIQGALSRWAGRPVAPAA